MPARWRRHPIAHYDYDTGEVTVDDKEERPLASQNPLRIVPVIEARMREIGITAADLVERADVPFTTVKYFGLQFHDQETLECFSVALEWPPGKLQALLDH